METNDNIKESINSLKDIAESKEAMDNMSKIDYDESKRIEEQNIKPETKGLIGLVYRDYICDDKEEYDNKYKIYLNNKG